MEDHFAFRGNQVDDEIALTDRAASGEHDEVGVRAGVERVAECRDGIFDRAIRHGDGAVGRDDRGEGEAVDVEDLSRSECGPGFDDFVAGGEDRDARLRVDLELSASDGRDGPDAGRTEYLATLHHHRASGNVRSLPTDVLATRSHGPDGDT